MSEGIPKSPKKEAVPEKNEYLQLAEALSTKESFPFCGVDPESYAKLKTDEAEFPGLVTPIDELLERFAQEGFKIVFGKNKESGNVFVLPTGSDNIREDSLFPRHLTIVDGMDEQLKSLILANKNNIP